MSITQKKIIYESDTFEGDFFSRFRIIKDLNFDKRVIAVPKWATVLAGLLYAALFAVLIAAVIILLNAKKVFFF